MKAGWVMAVALLAALCAGVYSLQLRLDMSRGEGEAAEEFMRLPDAGYLKVASLGYDELAADLLWLKAVQHMGEKKISGQGYDWIYKALDTVTTLDPKFVQAYETGGLILSMVADKVELSNRLLEKGVANNGDVWQLTFYLGFNLFYYQKDYKEAARYIERASRMEGSPYYLPLLASRLHVQADDPDASLKFLEAMYESTEDEAVRKQIINRANGIRALKTVRQLQEVVDEYARRSGRPPADIAQLVSERVIDRAPVEPNGGYYYIDKDGRVKSSKLDSHLGVLTR